METYPGSRHRPRGRGGTESTRRDVPQDASTDKISVPDVCEI